MRGTTIAVTLLLAATGAPGHAQIWDRGGEAAQPVAAPSRFPNAGIDRAIRDGRRSGQIDRRAARDLRRENRAIDMLAHRYRAGGLSAGEQAELTSRAEALRGLVAARRTTGR